VSGIPLRVRLALAFGVAMAVVLAVMGSLLYVRLGDSLLERLDDDLVGRGEVLSAILESQGDDLRLDDLRVVGDDEGFAQVIGPDSILAAFGYEGSTRLLTEEELSQARSRTLVVEREVVEPDGGEEEARLRAAPVTVGDRVLVVLTGALLEDREEALEGLVAQLLVVGPLALLLSSVGGYFLAGAALRPVEAMRRRAADISSDRADQRLPLPRSNDEIHRLGATLNDMLGRLESGLARERRFVADASHELRTPLTSLRTELELALRRPRSQAELEDALRSATEEVERLVRLAEDLLVLARADDGRLPLSLSPHYLREMLDSVAGRFDAQARVAGRALEVSADADEVFTGDRARLEQALGNLVHNALRHGAGTVRLDGEVENGALALAVSDDGAGFPLDFLPHAFERFSRVDVARAEAGSGLGLAIVDAIARAHGGSATAANRPTGGAEITLTIPTEPAHRAPRSPVEPTTRT
jgi:two-component system OmpR family sensor kinase